MQKEDSRVFRTKRDLREGLLYLMEKESFEKITVKDICDYTHLNKMTFYRHYSDKYDLLDDVVHSIADALFYKVVENEKVLSKTTQLAEACGTLTAEAFEECFKRKKAILSIVNSNNTLGMDILSSSIEAIIAHLLAGLGETYTLRYSKEHLSAFIVGGYSKLVLHMLNEDEFDKASVQSEFQSIFKQILEAKIMTK